MSTVKQRSFRDQQLGQRIEEELRTILAAAEDDRLREVEVCEVVTERGGRHFRVLFGPAMEDREWVSIDLQGKQMLAWLDGAKPYIRRELAGALNLKKTPDLTFQPDPRAWQGAGLDDDG
jgi:ribosome-binding factor A